MIVFSFQQQCQPGQGWQGRRRQLEQHRDAQPLQAGQEVILLKTAACTSMRTMRIPPAFQSVALNPGHFHTHLASENIAFEHSKI